MNNLNSLIVATGSYIPTKVIENKYFENTDFYDSNSNLFELDKKEIIKKFEEITGIKERRYVEDNLNNSDIGYYAAKDAIESSNIDKETIDLIICAHNFGNVKINNRHIDSVPSIAARIKHLLGIQNPKTIAFDVLFGCPGWLHSMILAHNYIQSGNAKRVLVVGTETLSRVSDPHDRDSLIYSDGAGATILEAVESEEKTGILSYDERSDTINHAHLLRMEKSYNLNYSKDDIFLKMDGHKLYKYALQTVPELVKNSLIKAKIPLQSIKKVLLHQANLKMDIEILKRLFELFGITDLLENFINKILPMSISWLGNSSVATIPTLLDLILKNKLKDQKISKGDIIVFASVGAGMNVNSMVYKF